MIVFGWGHQEIKEYGLVEMGLCPRCNNEELWQLKKISVWFTLFWCPVFPYEMDYWIICPVCSHGLKISKEESKKLIPLAQVNRAYIDGLITEDYYNFAITAIDNDQIPVLPKKPRQQTMTPEERKRHKKIAFWTTGIVLFLIAFFIILNFVFE